MKQITALGYIALTACLMTITAVAQVPREPPVKNGRVTGPFTAIAEEVDGKPGLIRIYLGGSGDEKSRVTASLSVGKGDQLKVSVPLAAYEHSRVNTAPAKDWSIEVRLTRELAEDAEISLYLWQSDQPTDTGQPFVMRVERLLPAATTQPVPAK